MHLTLNSWRPHRDHEEKKQDAYGLDSDLSEDKFGVEAEEALVHITGTPRKGYAAEKGETKTVRAVQHLFYDLKVINQITRDKYLPLQPVSTTKISMAWYGLGDAFKNLFGSGLSICKEGTYGTEDVLISVHARYGFWCE